ncbi:MAG: hypothetical protein ACE5KU_05275 [Nitrososphaerales archaeon]
MARYSMHVQVYEHHTRLIADDMFSRAVITSIKESYLPREYFDVRVPDRFLSKYMELDDNSIEHLLMQNAKGSARRLIQDIRARRLLKRAYILPLTKEGVPNPLHREQLINMDKNKVEEIEKKIIEEIDVKPGYVIVHPQSIKIKLYERFEQSIGTKEKPILILKRDGAVTSLDEESPISASMDPIRRLFVFCPKEYTKRVKKIAEDIFKAKGIY